jgi:hypothetical protein
MALTFYEQLTITVIDKAVIGLLLLGAGLAFNWMLERFKAQQTKAIEGLKSDLTSKLEKQREQRAAIADFAKKVSVGYQAMEWLTWIAKHNPKSFSELDINGYNEAMKRAFPEIVAARVVASAVDIDPDDVTAAIAEQLYLHDSDIAKLCVKYIHAPDSERQSLALETIGNTHERLLAADHEFVDKIWEFVRALRPR